MSASALIRWGALAAVAVGVQPVGVARVSVEIWPRLCLRCEVATVYGYTALA
jgi:hypothetical protein